MCSDARASGSGSDDSMGAEQDGQLRFKREPDEGEPRRGVMRQDGIAAIGHTAVMVSSRRFTYSGEDFKITAWPASADETVWALQVRARFADTATEFEAYRMRIHYCMLTLAKAVFGLSLGRHPLSGDVGLTLYIRADIASEWNLTRPTTRHARNQAVSFGGWLT